MQGALLWAIWLAQFQGAEGWSEEGHKRIARVAAELLKGKAQTEVARLLEGDLVELADWEQRMTKAAPASDMLHWHRQKPEWTCRRLNEIQDMEVAEDDLHEDMDPDEEDEEDDEEEYEDDEDDVDSVVLIRESSKKGSLSLQIMRPSDSLAASNNLTDGFVKEGNLRCDGDGTEDGSLFCALVYFFEHFSHEALLSEYPQPKDPLGTPAELKALDNLPPSERRPANYLRWLAILIGDMHQPLHWLRENSYGKDINVTFRRKQYNLLEIWEDVIPTSLPRIPSAQILEANYMQRQRAWWSKTPGELFRNWAREEAEIVCDQVYDPVADGVGHDDEDYESIAHAQREEGEVFTLDERLYQRWVALAEDFTTLAGQRLAFILLDILEHTKQKHAYREGRGRHHPKNSSEQWQKDARTNLCVAVMVVPTLLMAFCLHDMSIVPRRKSGIPDGSPTSSGSLSFWSPKSDVGSPATSWKLSGETKSEDPALFALDARRRSSVDSTPVKRFDGSISSRQEAADKEL